MKTFYVSLVRDFIGYYLKVESEREIDVRIYMKYYPRLWCSVYSEEFFQNEVQPKYGDQIKAIPAACGFIPEQFGGD